jgi:hypothetical protein
MNFRSPRAHRALLSLCFFLSVGCQPQDRDELKIHWKKRSYQTWLVQQRPYLASLPRSAIINYNFTTLQSGTNVSPVVTYELRAGKWEGVAELWFTVELDQRGSPIGFSEETATFIRLPAKESVLGEDGKKRNRYYGIKFRRTSEVADLINRVAAGGDFADYRKMTDEHGDFVGSYLDYNDPWKSRRAL